MELRYEIGNEVIMLDCEYSQVMDMIGRKGVIRGKRGITAGVSAYDYDILFEGSNYKHLIDDNELE